MPPVDSQKKKKKRGKKKKQFDDDFHVESAGIVQKLKQRYNTKKEAESEVVKDVVIQGGKLVHPTRYLSHIERGQKAQLNRLVAPDAPENVVKTQWICALCQRYSCNEDLGDLFGPYYIEADPTKPIPPFILAEGASIPTNEESHLDIYMHGRCALWSKDLFFFGGKFPKLNERLQQYWQTMCCFCENIGASVEFDGIHFGHFQCLLSAGFTFDADNFRILGPPPSPQRSAEPEDAVDNSDDDEPDIVELTSD